MTIMKTTVYIAFKIHCISVRFYEIVAIIMLYNFCRGDYLCEALECLAWDEKYKEKSFVFKIRKYFYNSTKTQNNEFCAKFLLASVAQLFSSEMRTITFWQNFAVLFVILLEVFNKDPKVLSTAFVIMHS